MLLSPFSLPSDPGPAPVAAMPQQQAGTGPSEPEWKLPPTTGDSAAALSESLASSKFFVSSGCWPDHSGLNDCLDA